MLGRLSTFLMLASVALAGCTEVVIPDVVPFRPAERQLWPADVDGDGTSEFIQAYAPGPLAGHLAIVFGEESFMALHQTGIVGIMTVPVRVRRSDRREWIVLPYYRSDSLFATVVDVMNLSQVTVPLATGQPRQVEGGIFPWDPRLNYAEIEDFDRDGDDDLLTVINTGYSRYPRGFFLHDLTTGQLIDSLLVDAAMNDEVRRITSRSPGRRWLLSSSASDNGASRGRLDDLRSFVFIVEYTDSLRLVADRRMGGLYSDADVLADPSTVHEGDPVPVLVSRGAGSGEPTYAITLDPISLVSSNRFDFPSRVVMAIRPRSLERTGEALVALTGNNQLIRIDATLDPSSVKTVPVIQNSGSLVDLHDVDGDGRGDFAVGVADGYDIYSNDLEYLAHVALPASPDAQLLPLATDFEPNGRYLVTYGDAMSYLLAFRTEVRLYPWIRYALWLLAVGAVLMGLVAGVHRWTLQRVTNRLRTELDAKSAAIGKLAIRVDLPYEPHDAAADLVIRISAALDRSALNRETSVTALADELGMSQRHLQRTCESLFGLSPHDLITRRRVLHAAARLTTSADLIKEIAFDSGFSSSAQLETAFKKHFGVLPTEYRAERKVTA